ncbi:MAG TPA: alpha-amylase family glycosyl hydrolase [Candidatus Saccharimonadia bacterium]|nr:alpha-amylase family glycosyl hydrolase [Candidatus Saccharimonadia bacterium]
MSQNDKQNNHRWPEGAIVYQIYPRSFYDSNGDGIGDIPGIIKKLDYLMTLGVNAIWLSPFYPSPMADFGYDVADYCDVDPIFGKLADIDELIKQAHKRNIKLMVDLVPNHTSDEHEWFHQSKQSREDKYSDWYIWKDPKGHDKHGNPIPPNNWIELLTGGPAWQWEPERRQFYLHSFDVKQADLNWSNPEVREAFKDVMRFWLDRGVDGFRVDAVPFMAKDPEYRDEPLNPDYKPGPHTWKYLKLEHPYNQGWAPMYAYLSEMASVLKEPRYADSHRFMVTEGYPNGDDAVAEYLAYYEGMDPAVSAPFNFEGLSMAWRADIWRKFLRNFHTALKEFDPLCVPSYAFGNHDQHRLATRLDEPAARAAAVLLLTLPGMSFVYNGDELGMKNGHVPVDMVQDPGAKGGTGRDPERTPLQWTGAKNAGFSTASLTWLPVADGYETVNVEAESKDPDSFLSLYRKLGKLRNESKSLRYGDFEVHDVGDEKVLCFTRTEGHERHLVLINFSKEPQNLTVEPLGKLVLSSEPKTTIGKAKHGHIHLRPHEAAIFVD